MTTIVGPRMPRVLLKMMYRLDFEPDRIVSKQELCELLAVDGVSPPAWVTKLWDEYESHESILARDPSGSGVLRFIRTITLRIIRECTIDGVEVSEVLWENILHADGAMEKRPHGNTVSEKMLWEETHPMRAVRRCLLEELEIRITHAQRRFLRHPYLQLITTFFGMVRDPLTDLMGELFKKADDPKRPGVTTYNFLYHWLWRMPEYLWREEYREPHDNKIMIFRWMLSQIFEQRTARAAE